MRGCRCVNESLCVYASARVLCMCVQACQHVCAFMCAHMHRNVVYTCTHTWAHVYTHVGVCCAHAFMFVGYVGYVPMRVPVCIHVRACVCARTRSHVCVPGSEI